MPSHVAKQGDCIESIAKQYGHFWQKIWNHPQNANLKKERGNPNTLLPGDEVYVPDKEQKQENGATERKHRFRLKGVPSKLMLRLMDDDEPRSNVKYILEIEGQLFSGRTDDNGKLEQKIPPDAKRGKLIVEDEAGEYDLELGYLDPPDKISGMQARLNNLAFNCGVVDGVLGPATEAALIKFQTSKGLEPTGKFDEVTQKALLEEYGC